MCHPVHRRYALMVSANLSERNLHLFGQNAGFMFALYVFDSIITILLCIFTILFFCSFYMHLLFF